MSPEAVAERYPAPPRRNLPPDWRPATWADIAPVLAEMEERPLESAEELEAWLLDRSEVDSLISAESSRRNVRAARHTDDEEAEESHLEYQTVVLPEVRKAEDRLDRRYLASPLRSGLDRSHWEVFDREIELAVRLFREENLPLESEEERLATEYGQLTGAMTVEYEGRSWTLPALAKFSESPDRSVRESVWRLAAARRMQDADRIEELFEKMLGLRVRMAENAGFPNFRDFRHQQYARFDYTPADCEALHASIERHVRPLLERLRADRRRRMGLDVLRPWDLACDPDGLPAFEPFQDAAGQVRVGAELMARIEPAFADDVRWMAEHDLLDLETRPHKRQGGFMDTLEDVRLPFIFANSGTTHRDVETLVHEGGHAIHALLCRDMEPVGYRHAPLEFSEVASMAMECMSLEHLGEVYPAGEARRASRASLGGVVSGLCWIAVVDAFQHRIYTEPAHGREQRWAWWRELRERFTPGTDDAGLEEVGDREWHRQLHVFEVPFYYVEYALAQIGALQVWRHYRRDPADAVRRYRAGLALGGSRPLPELYAAAGLKFDPRGELLGELMEEVERAWEALAGD